MSVAAPADSPPSLSGRIFLSYAAEDEAEVSRLAAALSSHGLPIIPAQREPRGTAAWKAQMQEEVLGCDVFVPVISPHTQARADGEFRQEWQVASERMPAIPEALPFVVPLVKGNIPPGTALVPESFRAIQWVPLPEAGEEVALIARLQEILRRYDRYRLRRSRQDTAHVWVVEPETPAPVEPRGRPLFWVAIAAVVLVAAGAGFVWRDSLFSFATSGPSDGAPKTTPTAVAVTPTPAPRPAVVALDSSRVLLAPFQNLTGDLALDHVGRSVGTEVTRILARALGVQIVPASAADHAAGIDAARKAGAGILVNGTYSRVENELQLRAQVTFVANDVSYGALGPVVLDSDVTGPVLTELIERLITGVSEASLILEAPPKRLGLVVYGRPWARWPLTQQARELAAVPRTEVAHRIADAEAILRIDSDMLGVKRELARAFCDAGRYDEADTLFGELFAKRGSLSQAELYDVLYDRSLLLGNLDAALAAARDRHDLQFRGGGLNDVLDCLFALGRPRSAFREITSWIEVVRPNLSPLEIARREIEAGVLETLMQIRYGETAKAQLRLAALKAAVGPGGSVALLQLEGLLLARAGSRADFDRLVDKVKSISSAGVLDSVRSAYNFHGQLLHVGRPDDAAYFLTRAQHLWSELPPAALASADAILLEADVRLAENRPADALAALDRATAAIKVGRELEFDGRRALALQDAGRASELTVLLNKLEAVDPRGGRGFSFYWRARLAARAGLKRGAIELLREAVTHGLWLDDRQRFAASYGRYEPEFAPLHEVPAYEDLLRPRE